MKRIAVISAVLDEPDLCQKEFNEVVAGFKHIVRGRMGIPFEEGVSVISITVLGEMDEINGFTGRLGTIPHVQVKTAVSKKELQGI